MRTRIRVTSDVGLLTRWKDHIPTSWTGCLTPGEYAGKVYEIESINDGGWALIGDAKFPPETYEILDS